MAKKTKTTKTDTATKTASAKKDKPAPAPADYLLCVGSHHYKTLDDFVSEAGAMGISRRMPSHHLPATLSLVGSRIWLAHGTGRKADGSDGVIFGYFKPTAIEFIAGPDGKEKYADIIAELKTSRKGDKVRIVGSTAREKARHCGHRKEGGTYLVATMAKGSTENPVVRTDDQAFEGRNFRGLMKLTPEQTAQLEAGKGLSTLHDVNCMNCGAEYKAATDTVKRIAVEQRRIDKGEEPKWKALCPKCAAERRKELAAERKAKREAEAAAEAGTEDKTAEVA